MTKEFTQRKKAIPITILSGFLGSGKTTLLESILTNDLGFKVAVIINDMSSINIDAQLIRNHTISKTEEKLIQLQNGCICCTLRGDLLEELIQLSQNADIDYIVIESTGISEPMQVAETFSTEFSEALLDTEVSLQDAKVIRQVIDAGGLNKIATIDTCVTVIDALSFSTNLETTDFLADRWGESGQGEAERTISDLLIDQIEFSDVIIINKISSVSSKQRKRIRKMVKSLNPVAEILSANYCKVDLRKVINTGKFDFEKASTSAGWLQSVNEMTVRDGYGEDQKKVAAPKPETEEYGIGNFVYNARRPFHPKRLYDLVRNKFFVIEQTPLDLDAQENGESQLEEDEDDDEDDEQDEDDDEDDEDNEEADDDGEYDDPSNEEILSNRHKSVFANMVRSKGFFWLASRYITRGEWSSAGPMLTLKGGLPWFAVTGTDGVPPEAKKLIEKDMKGEFGDRRNELVFIGLKMNKKEIIKKLDDCLLNEAEFELYRKVIREGANILKIEKALQDTFEDGFEDWIVFDDEEEIEEKSNNKHNHSHVLN